MKCESCPADYKCDYNFENECIAEEHGKFVEFMEEQRALESI